MLRLARHALLYELEAQVQQRWLEDAWNNMRSPFQWWLEARPQAVSGQQAVLE